MRQQQVRSVSSEHPVCSLSVLCTMTHDGFSCSIRLFYVHCYLKIVNGEVLGSKYALRKKVNFTGISSSSGTETMVINSFKIF